MNFSHIALTLTLAALATESIATPISPGQINITLVSPSGSADPSREATRIAWVKACKALGSRLTVGAGPWGFGAFASYACYLDNKIVSGIRKKSDWALRFTTDEQGLHLSLTHAPHNLPTQVMQQIDFPATESSYGYFKDPDLADITAYALLDSLPMLLLVDSLETLGTTATVAGQKSRANAKFPMAAPPESMTMFQLDHDVRKGRFNQIQRGKMHFAGYRAVGKKKLSKTLPREAAAPIWETDERSALAVGMGPLWAHNVAGAGAQRQKLNDMAIDAYKAIALDGAVAIAEFEKPSRRLRLWMRGGISPVRTESVAKDGKAFAAGFSFINNNGWLNNLELAYESVDSGNLTTFTGRKFIAQKNFQFSGANSDLVWRAGPRLAALNHNWRALIDFSYIDINFPTTATIGLGLSASYDLSSDRSIELATSFDVAPDADSASEILMQHFTTLLTYSMALSSDPDADIAPSASAFIAHESLAYNRDNNRIADIELSSLPLDPSYNNMYVGLGLQISM